LAVVHFSRSGQPGRRPEEDGVAGVEVPGDARWAGHGPGGGIDGEVIHGEAALDGGPGPRTPLNNSQALVGVLPA
jgi:hypothetical protein